MRMVQKKCSVYEQENFVHRITVCTVKCFCNRKSEDSIIFLSRNNLQSKNGCHVKSIFVTSVKRNLLPCNGLLFVDVNQCGSSLFGSAQRNVLKSAQNTGTVTLHLHPTVSIRGTWQKFHRVFAYFPPWVWLFIALGLFQGGEVCAGL